MFDGEDQNVSVDGLHNDDHPKDEDEPETLLAHPLREDEKDLRAVK